MLFTKVNADYENNNTCLKSNELEKNRVYVIIIRIVDTENFSSNRKVKVFNVYVKFNYAIFYIYI